MVGPLQKEEINAAAEDMAGNALRVLGMAHKIVPKDKTTLSVEDIQDLTFLGLKGMIDPPRPEVIEAVAMCKQAGIRPVMITGDHGLTALAIARDLGIVARDDNNLLTGEELDEITDDDLYELVESVSVFARVAPEHKLRIARQFQKRGHIVAMTGDGVNDAPALKAADIGVAMGITGTEGARAVTTDAQRPGACP